MRKVDQWSTMAEMLGNLIAKYADVLNIDSMTDENIKANIKNNEDKENIYKKSIEK